MFEFATLHLKLDRELLLIVAYSDGDIGLQLLLYVPEVGLHKHMAPRRLIQ